MMQVLRTRLSDIMNEIIFDDMGPVLLIWFNRDRGMDMQLHSWYFLGVSK